MIRPTALSFVLLVASLPSMPLAPAREPLHAPPGPPTETMVVVRSPETPLLNEIKPSAHPPEVAHPGDLLEVLRPLPPMNARWKSVLVPDGPTFEREGAMAEVRRAPGGSILFAFASDLGETVEVPRAAWLCEQIARDASLPEAARSPRCASRLQRIRLPSGAIAAFESCAVGPCPVALWRDGRLAVTTVSGIVLGRWVPGGADGALLATTRWVRAEGRWSGGAIVPFALSGDRPRRLREIRLDETDARRGDRVTSREVTVEITFPAPDRSVVRLFGRRRQLRSADGRELAWKPIEERHRID